jgi:acyl carrier protein
MKRTREEIKTDTLLLLQRLADDWEYGGHVTEDTCLLADMGFESLDVVILSAQVQEHYGQVLPFSDLFSEIGQRERKDISVGEWVDFVHKHLDSTPAEIPPERARA